MGWSLPSSTATACFSLLRSVRVVVIVPVRSHMTTIFAPAVRSSRAVAMPAAPAPRTTTRRSAIGILQTPAALRNAARTTMAVPC